MWLERIRQLFLIVHTAPFFFNYDGQPSATLLPEWECTVSTNEADNEHRNDNDAPGGPSSPDLQTITWKDPQTRLRVTADFKAFREYSAVEWLCRFENLGSEDCPLLDGVQALDVLLAGDEPASAKLPAAPDLGSVTLHTIAGSDASQRDFSPIERELQPGQSIELAPVGGRSSNGAFPFYYLDRGNGRGLFVAIGWTGQWTASIIRDANGTVRLTAGMQRTHLRLHPGESIRTPRILLMSWTGPGDRQDAHNAFRRLLLAHYLPKIDGKTALPAIAAQSFNHSYQGKRPSWNTQAGQLASAKINRALGCDTLWLDAAWFLGGFPSGVGNWTVQTDAYPDGLAPIGKACHELGLKFLVWYEPERVAPDSLVATQHPEFVLGLKDGQDGLFNLGDDPARRWLTDLLLKQIDEFGIDVYRNDFNYLDPLVYWRSNDPPDRQGISEIRYVEGFYAMWDEIRAKRPGSVPDNCSGGGRRIDLEMCMRSLVQTRSDAACVPGRADWDQCQTCGLSRFLPVHATIGWELGAYECRSSATAGYAGEWDILADDFPMEAARLAIKEIKENQPYWTGDFYTLTPCTLDQDSNVAFQFHRPDASPSGARGGSGIVLAFRRAASTTVAMELKLRGLDADRNYEVEIVDEDRRSSTGTMTGREMAQALKLSLEKPKSSLLVRYMAAR